MECETEKYEDSGFKLMTLENDTNCQLSDDKKKNLWMDFTNCVRTVQSLRLRSKQSKQPKREPKDNRIVLYSEPYNKDDEKTENIQEIVDLNEFVDEEMSQKYKWIDYIISTFEKLHIAEIKPNAKKDLGISFRRLGAIFGLNQVLEMVDLQIAMTCICFNQHNYQIMKKHLMRIEEKPVKGAYYLFIKETFKPNNYNKDKFDIYIQGLNVSQATRLMGTARLTSVLVGIRKLNNIDVNDDDEKNDEDYDEDNNGYDDDDDDDEYNKGLSTLKSGSDERRLNYYSREAQQYLLAFIVAMSRHLLKDYCHLNCSVILDLKTPSIDEKPPQQKQYDINMSHQDFGDKMDSLSGKFEEVFANQNYRPEFRDNVEKEHQIPYWCIDVSSPHNQRIKAKPKFLKINKQDLGIDLDKKQYKQDFDKCHWFHLMRVKRYFSENAMKDKNQGNCKRIGVSVHKFNQTLKLYLHFEGGIIRIVPQDIVKWIPYLFMYRDNELNLDLIGPYLQRVLKDNQNLAVESWSSSLNDHNTEYMLRAREKKNIWKQIKSWDQLDSQFIKKRNKLLQVIKKLDGMKSFYK